MSALGSSPYVGRSDDGGSPPRADQSLRRGIIAAAAKLPVPSGNRRPVHAFQLPKTKRVPVYDRSSFVGMSALAIS
jgi:hypothetical protein